MSTLPRRSSNRPRKESTRARETREAKEEDLAEFSFTRGRKRKQDERGEGESVSVVSRGKKKKANEVPASPGPSNPSKAVTTANNRAGEPRREYQDPWEDDFEYRSDTVVDDCGLGGKTSRDHSKGKNIEIRTPGPAILRVQRSTRVNDTTLRPTGGEASVDPTLGRRRPLESATPMGILPRVSPAVTDRLLLLESQAIGYETELVTMRTSLAEMTANQETILNMSKDLHSVITNELALRSRVDGMSVDVNALLNAVDRQGRVSENVNGVCGQETVEETQGGKGKGKKVGGRDNELNTIVRRGIHLAMGIPDGCPANALPTDFKPGGGWIKDPENDGQQLLRPDYMRGFVENSSWHDKVERLIRQKAPTLVLSMTKERMAEIPRARIIETMAVVMKGVNQKYRNYVKETEQKKAGVTVPHHMKPEVMNRRRTRKDRKLKERRKHRLPGMGKEWDAFFQIVYQSTDQSDAEHASQNTNLDPNTDEEGGGQTQKNGTSSAGGSGKFKTHPPTYRSDVMISGIAKIDAKIKATRRKSKVSTNMIESTRLEPRDKPLPRLGAGGLRMPRDAIDPAWLQEHDEFNDPAYVMMSDEEYDGDYEGGGDAEEDE